jgi:hypothetical protein
MCACLSIGPHGNSDAQYSFCISFQDSIRRENESILEYSVDNVDYNGTELSVIITYKKAVCIKFEIESSYFEYIYLYLFLYFNRIQRFSNVFQSMFFEPQKTESLSNGDCL